MSGHPDHERSEEESSEQHARAASEGTVSCCRICQLGVEPDADAQSPTVDPDVDTHVHASDEAVVRFGKTSAIPTPATSAVAIQG